MTKNTTLADLLRGCTPGRVQSVGNMQVIPLVSDTEDTRFAAPDILHVRTSHYGTLVFRNSSSKMALVPRDGAYVVKQAAQDHALPHVGIVKARDTRQYDDAVCIQQSQGGHITEGDHSLIILPFMLREAALSMRSALNFSRLWEAISHFNTQANVQDRRGNLVSYVDAYKVQLQQFVAQFEPVNRQVGAIFIVGGRLAGVERTPNYDYWLSIWETLVRECYGSLALMEAQQNPNMTMPGTRVDIPLGAKRTQHWQTSDLGPQTLSELTRYVELAEEKENEAVRSVVRDFVDEKMAVDVENDQEGFAVWTMVGHGFTGQSVMAGDDPVYASLTATANKRAMRQAARQLFSI